VTNNLTAALAAACLIAPAAYAQEAPARYAHAGSVELTWDHFDSDVDDTDTVAAKIDYEPSFRIAGRLTVQGKITIEGVEDTDGDTAFEGMGAYAETLSLQYAGDAFTLYAGKFNPGFGLAADVAPGLYGDDMPKTYETTERVGLGGDVNLMALHGGLSGEHVLTVAAFTMDRSLLSRSIIVERDRTQLADGGAGNTEGLDSHLVSLDGQFENGFGYSLGYRTLATDMAGEADERGVVAGISYAAAVAGFDTEWAGEAASFDNDAAVPDATRTAITLTGALRRGDWFGGLILSGSDTNGAGDVRLAELSIGRDFEGGLTLDGAVQSIREDSEDAWLFGLRLTWGFG
jgi:hypothetical protein